MPRHSTTGHYITHPASHWKDTIKLVRGRRREAPDAWEALYKIDGKWTLPRSLATTDAEVAKAKSVEQAQRLISGQPEPEKAVRQRGVTVSDAAKLTISKLKQQHAAQARIRSDTKLAKFARRLRLIETVLEPAFGSLDLLAANDQERLNRWLQNYTTKDGRRPARSSIGQLNSAWQAIMLDAYGQGWINKAQIGRFPTRGHETGERRPDISEPEMGSLIRFLASDWVQTGHTEVVRQDRVMTRVYVALLASTGIRPGLEIEGLTWERVQSVLDSARKPGVRLFVMRKQGKHKDSRPIWATNDPRWNLRKILAEYKSWREQHCTPQHDARNPEGLLFHRPLDGVKPNYSVCIRHLLEDAGVRIDRETGQQRCPYSFRHYYATQRLIDGVEHAAICANMGTSLAMLQKHYGHVMADTVSARLTSPRKWKDYKKAA